MVTVAEALQAALRHQQAGRLQEAERIYRQVLLAEPGQPDALHLLGVACVQAGRSEEAVHLVRAAVAAAPAQPLYYCSLANALAALGQFDPAVDACREALRLRPDFAEAHASLGNVFRSCGRLADAEAAFREAVRLRPDHADAHNNLGNVLRAGRRLAEAEACYREALRLRPGYVPALGNLGTLARDGLYQFRPEDADQTRALLAEPTLPLEARCVLSFSLAHVRAREHAHDEAFSVYRGANEARATLFRARGRVFDRERHLRFVDQAAALCTPEFFRRATDLGNPSELPVFVVGMPRSGTTLVEQILSSHPLVHGAGELPASRTSRPGSVTQARAATRRACRSSPRVRYGRPARATCGA